MAKKGGQGTWRQRRAYAAAPLENKQVNWNWNWNAPNTSPYSGTCGYCDSTLQLFDTDTAKEFVILGPGCLLQPSFRRRCDKSSVCVNVHSTIRATKKSKEADWGPVWLGPTQAVYHQKIFALHNLCATYLYVDINSGPVWINPNIIDLCLHKLCII
jgi:hypothetical protein